MLDVKYRNVLSVSDSVSKESFITDSAKFLPNSGSKQLVSESLKDATNKRHTAQESFVSTNLLDASIQYDCEEFSLERSFDPDLDNETTKRLNNNLSSPFSSSREHNDEADLDPTAVPEVMRSNNQNDSCPSHYNFEIEILDGSYMKIEVQHSSESESESESESFHNKESNETPTKRFCEADNLFQPLLTRNGSVFETLLEKNSFMCSGIDDWFISDEPDFEQRELHKPDLPSNRSGYPKYREKRIENLKLNLNPFYHDPTVLVKKSLNSNRYSPVELDKRVRSFSAFKGPTSPNSVVEIPPFTSNIHCHAVPSCVNSREFSPSLMDWDEPDEDDLCYDSDPNELLVSCKMTGQAKKKDSFSYISKNIHFVSKDRIRTMSELMGTRILLVWHRPSPYDQCPAAVHAWIEHGSYLKGGVIQPRLMWQESCGKQQKEGERFVLNKLAFHSLDLLDICKVFAAKAIDRSVYPLANGSRSLIIRTSNKELLFEAEDRTERDKFVESMKILVARLASLIIVGDRCILKEFFNSDSFDVPGKAPIILADPSDESSLDDSFF